ncbi:hypothetical protein PLEOSDRAFT_51142 [Pleurotus ostreatus PC15]|uniref:RRM domain-containing protein n=1 Tax=Pleurotus ostreatus (strain PC15) TaxID=1137138 RepID=A0A067NU08_PLEO1|nr:hypothetical protein PLEOSDRAFT_51142 [Pleurotus ostreatus PC15]
MSNAPPPVAAAAGSSAEAQAAAFADDPRIYYDKESGSWKFEGDDGTEMEYDGVKGKWVSILDEELVKAQQAAYSVAGVDEETPAAPVLARENKKRKQQVDYTSATPIDAPGPSIKRGRNDKSDSTKDPKPPRSKNTAVYVTNLPLDTEQDELVARFSKCGIIEEDDNGEPKVKMYALDDGTFNGQALVVYFKEDSVDLALNLLDEAELRIGDSSTVMKVQRADFAHKASGGGAAGGSSGEHKPRKTVDKKKITKRMGKMQRKLEDWDEEDSFGFGNASTVPGKNSRVVVLKHMFTLKELEEDASLLLDLKEDVRDECSTLGEVTNVTLYDKEPDGVMTVKFREPLSAHACIVKMNGRFFSGRRIEASLFVGKQRFKRSGTGDEITGDGDEAEKKRLDDFANWLMTEGD